MPYKCAVCNTQVSDINQMGKQCEKCGSKIFYKVRPHQSKRINGR
jgi:DNA-directed RNA polymerase subunit P